MKNKLLLFVLLLPFFAFAQNSNTQDSLSLVDLYNSTNGPTWKNNSNWLTTAPLNTWYGVFLSGDRVSELRLASNNLNGSLPSSLGNLAQVNILNFGNNLLTGNIPASLATLPQMWLLDISYNHLSGAVPASFSSMTSFASVNLKNNNLTFSGMETIPGSSPAFVYYFPQLDIPLIQDGTTLSVAAGGTKANNTYTWYKDNTMVAVRQGDSTYTIAAPGNYSVEVTNSKATQLTLYSITSVNAQDSLALVDLYNATGGASWLYRTNWLTTAPVDTWYGATVRKGNLVELMLVGNNLSGNLPLSAGNFSNLRTLELSNNSLSGNIPASIGGLANLKTLSLDKNNLSGNIPEEISSLSSLATLTLNDNQLSGNIPSSIGNLSALENLYLNNNQLSGALPASLGNLNLRWLQANNNQLSGSLPAFFGRMKNLAALELYNNGFSGSIPDSIVYAANLGRLELHNNQLTGKIPDSIGKLLQLFSLWLNNNHLSGPVPVFPSDLRLSAVKIDNNGFTFDGMESLETATNIYSKTYTPQANIPIRREGNALSVSAGGTLANDTFRLYRNGVLSETKVGDSTFTITDVGKYNITVSNAVATQLVLNSDTTALAMMLPDGNVSTTAAINGTSATSITDGVFVFAALTPTSTSNPLSGNVTISISLDTTVSVYNSLPYVQRHYDITPAANASSAQATVTLYYTQQEFDNYNTYVTANHLSLPLLPTNGIDNGNVRITQFHGSFTGSSSPANYNGGTANIVPGVTWDNNNQWWVVTFPVSGFSGFYLSTQSLVLPLTLLQFTGALHNSAVALTWATTDEIKTKQYEVEKSSDGVHFYREGIVMAQSTPGNHQYQFSDIDQLNGDVFYRLKMVDQDGHFTYSSILRIIANEALITLTTYPNPVREKITLSFYTSFASLYRIEVVTLSGEVVKRINGLGKNGMNTVEISFTGYRSGLYFINLIDGKHGRRTVALTKL